MVQRSSECSCALINHLEWAPLWVFIKLYHLCSELVIFAHLHEVLITEELWHQVVSHYTSHALPVKLLTHTVVICAFLVVWYSGLQAAGKHTDPFSQCCSLALLLSGVAHPVVPFFAAKVWQGSFAAAAPAKVVSTTTAATNFHNAPHQFCWWLSVFQTNREKNRSATH